MRERERGRGWRGQCAHLAASAVPLCRRDGNLALHLDLEATLGGREVAAGSPRRIGRVEGSDVVAVETGEAGAEEERQRRGGVETGEMSTRWQWRLVRGQGW